MASNQRFGEFYRRALDATEQLEYDVAVTLEGVQGEIAIIRLLLLDALGEPGPEDDDVLRIKKLVPELVRLIAIEHRISGKQGVDFGARLAAVLEDVGDLMTTGIA